MEKSEAVNPESVMLRDYSISTACFAAAISNTPGTIRKNYCLNGHHLGAKPLKRANGRLMWAQEDIESILKTGSAK